MSFEKKKKKSQEKNQTKLLIMSPGTWEVPIDTLEVPFWRFGFLSNFGLFFWVLFEHFLSLKLYLNVFLMYYHDRVYSRLTIFKTLNTNFMKIIA